MTKPAPSMTRVSPEALAAYEPVIGLEVHTQLKTATKIFCACSTRFGDPPNSNTCPVCLALPGALPVLNRRALDLALRASLALHLQVQERSIFARKNYFYPDLPKGYQISMYEQPLAINGWLDIVHEGVTKRIGITRRHAPRRNRFRAGHALADRGLRLSDRAQANSGIRRSQRLQYGRGLSALRR